MGAIGASAGTGALGTAFAGGSGRDFVNSIVDGLTSGAVTSLIGFGVGKWAVKALAGFGINGINSPVLKSALAGSFSSGLSGGAAAFGTELLMGGDLESAWEAAKKGAKFGVAAGAVIGGYSGYKQAVKNFVNPWNGKFVYPENNGALGEWTSRTLNPGERIDRYGSVEGNYFSPEGTPTEMRSLHPSINTDNYHLYEVLKSFDVQSSTIAPFYNQPGLGTQLLSKFNAKYLLENGYIKKIY